ncbi:S-layer homology domain-containing protein [Paenibacillus antarcticus]|nr:S-layer homology domain-containing protein [Paenibacillus antarcticus]
MLKGAATSAGTVNLSVSGTDPDAGDSVTHMRFANSAAGLTAAAWLPFSNTATFSLSGGDGSKAIYMQLKDSKDGISANSSQTILLDQTAPTGTLIINDGAIWTKSNTITLKGTYTDGSGSGVNQARLSNISGSWLESWFSVADLNGKSWNLLPGEGAKTVYVQYKDIVGNESTATIRNTIGVDTIAPIISNVENGKVYKSKVIALFNEGFGMLNGSPYTSGTDITQDGTYTLIVTDPAGNSTTVKFNIDITAPVVSGVTNNGIYNRNVTITFNKGTATLNGAAFISGSQVALDGMYTLVVTDAAGNVTTVSFLIDKVAPTVIGVTNNGNYKKAVTVTFNEGTATLNGILIASGTEIIQDGTYTLVVTDAPGNVTTVSFMIDKAAPIVTGVANGGNYKEKVTVGFNEGTATLNGIAFTECTEIVLDGAYTLVVTDAAGNITTIQFLLDTHAPIGTIIIHSGTEWTNETNAILNLTSDDGSEGSGVIEMRFSSNGADWSNWEASAGTKEWTLEAGDGVRKVFVQFKDKVGNVNSTVIQDSIKLDQTVPSGTLVINGGAATTSSKVVNLSLNSSDGVGSGVSDMRFSSDELTWSIWESVSSMKNWNLNGDTGLKKIFVQFRDVAGNTSKTSGAIIDYQLSSGTANQDNNSGSSAGAGNTSISSNSTISSNGKLTLPASGAGQVSLNGEITISIPVNATTKVLELEIEKVKNIHNMKGILASSIYEVDSNFLENFKKSVTLTMLFESMKLDSNQTAALFYYDEASKGWLKANGSKISGNRISIEMHHIRTKYAVLVVDKVSGLPVEQSIDMTTEGDVNDVTGHWAESSIKEALSDGIVKGYVDGSFKPNATVTRAEFAVMLINALKPAANGIKLSFVDKKKIGDWAHDAVAQAVQLGVINGYEDGTFRPSTYLTRAEMASIIANVLKLSVESSSATGFTDDKSIPTWANNAVVQLNKLGLIEGKGNNRFEPNATTTRAEAVTLLLKMLVQVSK